jgi:hypothetical protein
MQKLSKLPGAKLRTTFKSLFSLKKSNFSEDLDMPIIDFRKFINKSEGWERECKLTADCLHDSGVLVVRDPVSHP